jgi:hypothetical protein
MSFLSEQSAVKISILQRGKLTEEIAVVRLSLMDVLQAPANIQDVREVMTPKSLLLVDSSFLFVYFV